MYLIYGLQKSGISIIELFEKKKIEYKLWDDSLKVRNIFGKKYYDRLMLPGDDPNNL